MNHVVNRVYVTSHVHVC